MTISLRLSEELERGLKRAALEEGVSKSELVRRCLSEYLSVRKRHPTPWELGKDLFGKRGSGRRDLSTKGEDILSELIHARKSRR